jgi:hypothetical protein
MMGAAPHFCGGLLSNVSFTYVFCNEPFSLKWVCGGGGTNPAVSAILTYSYPGITKIYLPI